MIFKDRAEAGRKLAAFLKKDFFSYEKRKDLLVVSLLRGGAVVGAEISKSLEISHLPLAAVKISAPHNPELAIGALCFQSIYLDENFINLLGLTRKQIREQINLAKEKSAAYIKKFSLDKIDYRNHLENKRAIIVDDGVATGSTIKASRLFVKSCQTKEVYLAAPVAPVEFQPKSFNKIFILSYEPFFSAISQFYQEFPQLTDEEVVSFFSVKIC